MVARTAEPSQVHASSMHGPRKPGIASAVLVPSTDLPRTHTCSTTCLSSIPLARQGPRNGPTIHRLAHICATYHLYTHHETLLGFWKLQGTIAKHGSIHQAYLRIHPTFPLSPSPTIETGADTDPITSFEVFLKFGVPSEATSLPPFQACSYHRKASGSPQ